MNVARLSPWLAVGFLISLKAWNVVAVEIIIPTLSALLLPVVLLAKYVVAPALLAADRAWRPKRLRSGRPIV